MHARDNLMKRTKLDRLICCSLVLATCHLAVADDSKSISPSKRNDAEGVRIDPVVKQIEGWTVYIDPQLLEGEHRDTGARALQMLPNHVPKH